MSLRVGHEVEVIDATVCNDLQSVLVVRADRKENCRVVLSQCLLIVDRDLQVDQILRDGLRLALDG